MTDPQKQSDSYKLEAYLDGQLPDQERADFAREIAAAAELQAQVELQKQIDESLHRRFKPLEVPANLAVKLNAAKLENANLSLAAPKVELARKQPRNSRRLAFIAVATAATLVWGILGWQFFSADSDVPNYDPNQPLAEIYNKQVAASFKPIWVCEDDKEFASTFRKRQGQALLLAAMPPGTKMEGLTYCGGISRYTTTMLARVDGKPVMVFVDRANADSFPSQPPANSGLHLFRKELGPLVLYELTPLDLPTVMDYLKLAEGPPGE